MHRALYLDDVLNNIFSRLSRKDNYHLACMCRAFVEPALDQVWKTLEMDLDPLFTLWPMSARTTNFKPKCGRASELRSGWPMNQDVISLTRVLKNYEWKRFDVHARRVREFQTTVINPYISASVPYLVASLTMRPKSYRFLLPRLSKLSVTFNLKNEREVGFLSLLMGPSLLNVLASGYIGRPSGNEDTVVGVSRIFNIEHNQVLGIELKLQRLEMFIVRLSTTTSELGSLLSQLRELRAIKLRVDCGGYDVFRPLGQLPKLREMDLRWNMSDIRTTPEDPVAGWFPSLQSVNLESSMILHVLAGSEQFDIRRVTTLFTRDPLAVYKANTIIRELGSKCPLLEALKIDAPYHCTSSTNISGCIDIVPLLQCSKMRELVFIGPDCTAYPGEADLSGAAMSWPDLEIMEIIVRCHGNAPPGATLRSICKLANQCPKLTKLDVYVDGTPLDTVEEVLPLTLFKSISVAHWEIRSKETEGLIEGLIDLLDRLAPPHCTPSKWIKFSDYGEPLETWRAVVKGLAERRNGRKEKG